MTGRVRSNNNNALDPRTMPPGGARTGSAGRKSVQHGASVPVMLCQRGIGAARTTALGKKFAAVGYDPVAMQGFVTNFDTQRLMPRYTVTINDLLETFDKEFSEIYDMRSLFEKNSFGTMKYNFEPLMEHYGALGTFLAKLIPMYRVAYFNTAMRLDMTVRVLEGILAEWRIDRPTEFDQSKVTALANRIAAKGLRDFAMAALKTEVAECDCKTADHDAFRRSFRARQNGMLFASNRGRPQNLEAFKRAALPAFIALIEHSDPAEARKIFSKLLEVHKEDTEVDLGDCSFVFKMYEEEINQKSEEISESGRCQLSELTTEHEGNSKRDDYVGLMGDFLYAYSKINEGYLRDGISIVEDLHGLLDHFVWKDD